MSSNKYEHVVRLADGRSLRTDTYADHPAGASYVRLAAADGTELAYWTSTEWADEPELVMGAILGAAAYTGTDEPAYMGVLDYWADDPTHPAADWQYEVANGDTRLGYHAWVDRQHDLDKVRHGPDHNPTRPRPLP